MTDRDKFALKTFYQQCECLSSETKNFMIKDLAKHHLHRNYITDQEMTY